MSSFVAPLLAAVIASNPPSPSRSGSDVPDDFPIPVGHSEQDALHRTQTWDDTIPPASELRRDPLRRRARIVYGYLPYWTTSSAVIRWDWLSHLAWFAAPIGADGRLTSEARTRLGGSVFASIRQQARDHSVPLIVTFTNFDNTEIASLVGAQRTTTLQTIVDAVVQSGAQGANVDFEFVPAASRDAFSSFMRDLTTQLHAAVPGSHVTSATPMIDWGEAYDERALTADSDGIMVMIYGCAWGGTSKAKAVTPLRPSATWGSCSLERTLDRLESRVGASNHGKIIAGLPWYGYRWTTDAPTVPAATAGTGSALPYDRCDPAMESAGKRWDQDSDTPYAVTSAAGTHKQVWCDDAQSFRLKTSLVRGRDIGGIGLWALGYDGAGDELWQAIRDDLGEDVVPPNGIPVADAGSDVTGVAGEAVSLDGSGSWDPDGQELVWRWSVASGPVGASIEGGGARPSFVGQKAGIYVIDLVVSDGIADSVVDSVTVTLDPAPVTDPTPPEATDPPDTGAAGDGPPGSGCGCAGVSPVSGVLALAFVRRRRVAG